MRTKVIVVGIGGSSCAGKTLLAKHLVRLLPNALLVHQDDFAPPSSLVPFSAEHGVQDWDDPATASLWGAMRRTMRTVRNTRALENGFKSYVYHDKMVEVPVDAQVAEECAARLIDAARESEKRGVKVSWVVVEGFILYWDQVVAEAIDVKMFVRVPRDRLKARREARAVYVMHNPAEISSGNIWTDPPNYFDNIVYPGYIKSHAHLFEGGDVEAGAVISDSDPRGIQVIAPQDGPEGMTYALEATCDALVRAVNEGVVGRYIGALPVGEIVEPPFGPGPKAVEGTEEEKGETKVNGMA